MIRHYELESSRPCGGLSLVFDWDIEAGVVSGPGAKQIIELASDGRIDAYPVSWTYEFSDDPLKSKADMAAIVGFEHHLPSDLIDFYPQPPDDGLLDETYIDVDGMVVIGIDQVEY